MIEHRIATIEAMHTSDEDAGSLVIEGYAAKFGVPSHPVMVRGKSVIETIAPTAFDLATDTDVSLYWQHNSGMPLANTRSKTLQLEVDDVGLRFRAEMPNTTLARDAVALMRSGIVDQVSFGFVAKQESNTTTHRTLQRVQLHEISLVERAAYPQTAAAARAFDSSTSTPSARNALRLRRLKGSK